MKNIFTSKLLATLVIALTLMLACTEDIADVRLDPKLSTSEVLNLASSEATIIGFIVAAGDGFTEKGVCYDIATEPTIDDNKFVYAGTETGATFSVTLTGLDYATMYYVRAYATNSAGTIYGEEMTFTTTPVVPTVTTAAVTAISYTSASSGGEVTVMGGADVTARGVCYSITANPTIDDSKTTDGDGTGTFTSSLSGLANGTMYYVRAYATNSAGTGYGPEETFTTLVPLDRTWYIPGNYVAASYPGSTLADWSPDKSPYIKSALSAPESLEGYVYMAGGANEWKVATTTSWDDTNYGGVGGVLDAGSPNISNGAGYYKINVDAAALTYTALATTWGLIGDATPGGWGGDTPLTYQPELTKWTGAMHLTAASIKFRSNGSWDAPNPNYGSTAADETLNEGGDNIAITTEGDYAITLDLSTPLAYTYRADMWGIIGDATPGGWDTDTDMTWDAGNGVFTATLDLTAASWKFRANDAWDYSLGGDVGTLVPGGDNIAVSVAGNYTITLDPWNMVATITMN